jgi:serine/threonine protein kinase
MAPEQARGEESDERCDVYASGVMLYELLTGYVPFTGATPLNVLTAHLTSPVEPPRVRAPDRAIPPALDALVVHALAKDPAQRYSSATALAAALGHARDRPDDVEGVKPSTVRLDVDVHGPTIPSGIPAYTPPRAPAPAPASLSPRAPAASPRDSQPSDALGARGWAVLWILAALIGISVGVWLSLHMP